MTFREALLTDIPAMQGIRNAVRENVLSDPARVTAADYREYLLGRGRGWVCGENDEIAGFAIADLTGNNIWALFVRPGREGQGIGKRLHALMLDWYFSRTGQTVWLSTEPGTRAERFYRAQGWRDAGMQGGELRFEMDRQQWAVTRAGSYS